MPNSDTDTMTVVERWLPVVGLEGLYEVSDLGRVQSVHNREIVRCGRPASEASRAESVALSDIQRQGTCGCAARP
jgi:hypothetical protein